MMDEPIKKYREIDDMLDMSDLFDDEKSSINPDDSIRDSVLGGQVIKDGIQTQENLFVSARVLLPQKRSLRPPSSVQAHFPMPLHLPVPP